VKTDSDKLFVYGSLQRGYALHGHLRQIGARLLGIATLQAQWQPQSRYPGAWPSPCPFDRIEGELYLLNHPLADLELLDSVEEIDHARPERSLYVRRLSWVQVPTGRRFLAWVYFLPPQPSRRRLITGNYNSAGPLQAAAKKSTRKERP
jgi:gamma-glutamylcyclotransferase (GGCT)/AIG2-like uncharacterized protein YtfP